ncbi:MAG: stage V sporulation protein AD [Acutalibacteraceae bacterium]
MAIRKGKTIFFEKDIHIIANSAVVGKTEADGPLGHCFDKVFTDSTLGEDNWEMAESSLLKAAVNIVLEKSAKNESDIDLLLSGDLLGQSVASIFAHSERNIPFCGLYGACSTMALSMLSGSLAIESGGAETVIAATSSHFCSAEKQFRFPVEYGGQRTPTAQRTVTGAGAVVLQKSKNSLSPKITKGHFGTITDYGVIDSTNMGAAMAPAAAKTITDFMSDTKTAPADYDLILTGDLGQVGTSLLYELLLRESGLDISKVHNDCGLMIYNRQKQDVHAGGSGCGCSASVLCGHIIDEIRQGKYKNLLFIATGALMSPISSREGSTIPGIANLVNIEM